MDFTTAMRHVLKGATIQQDHKAWRDLGRKLRLAPGLRTLTPKEEGKEIAKKPMHRDAGAVGLYNVEKHLLRAERNELNPYTIVGSDRSAEWMVVD
jgi:hypothetical protein